MRPTLLPVTRLIQQRTNLGNRNRTAPYHGGGEWYALDIDYDRVATLLRKAKYRGYVSLEMEGKEAPATAIPQSLALLRKAFGA